MQLYLDGNRIRPSMAFTLYFTVMFCFYTNTYIQLLAQILILAYVFIPFFRWGMKLSVGRFKNIGFYLVWYGALVALLFASTKWAYSTYDGSKTLITQIRIFIIGLGIFYYINTKEKVYSILQSFIISCAIMGALAFITSIIFGYGIFNSYFGTPIGQHRNQIGAVAAPLTFICYYLYKNHRFNYGKGLAVYFFILTFVTGSMSSIVQLGIIFALCMLTTSDNISKAARNIILLFLGIVAAFVVIRFVPFLNEKIFSRMYGIFNTLFGNSIDDMSALGRDFYKEIAFTMFLERPVLGWGVDGFVCFLRDNPFIMGVTRLGAVYSHCNYAELATDLGVVGLVVWYVPIIRMLVKAFKQRKATAWNGVVFSVYLSMILFDYSRIPWETHLIMYMFFIIIFMIRYSSDQRSVGER